MSARPTFASVAWQMAKVAVRNWRTLPHLLAVAGSFLGNYGRMRRAHRRRNGSLAIALIEHMGDIVAAEPVSRFARHEHPDRTIMWVCRSPYRELADNFHSVDTVIIVRCMTEWLLLWSARAKAPTWDLHISERPCLKCGISFRKPGGPGRITYDTYLNHGNLLRVNCLSAGITPLDDPPELHPDAAAIRAVDELGLPERFVVIHCKSNEDSRDWQLAHWQALVRLVAEHRTVCEIGSKPLVITRDDQHTRNLCGTLSVMATAEVIRRAELFIGIDSGPAHLANATGTPGVVLLGSYHTFRNYLPFSGGYADGSLCDLIRGDGPARDIGLAPVLAAVLRRLEATPAHGGGRALSPGNQATAATIDAHHG